MENTSINISEIAQKPLWERRAASQRCPQPMVGNMNDPQPMNFDDYARFLYSQADFEAEKQPSAHLIYNVSYRSNRPMYKYDETLAKNVKCGYEKVERVSVALQKSILRHKTTHSFGNPVWFGNEGDQTDTELVNLFKSYWNSVGMNNAMIEWGKSCFGTGDGAIYLYRDEDKELRYKVFGYEKGDLIASFTNPDDGFKRNVIRKFKEHGNEAVEIYRSTTVQKWVKADPKDKLFKRWYQKAVGTRSTDGYILISEPFHGLTVCPVVYHREPDVCWGDVQGNIEDIEKLLSDLLENGKYYNYQMLFVSGIVGGLPNINFQGKVIASRNKDGDAKILAPADASNTFDLSLDNSFKMLCDGVGAVFIRPEELKSGDYSGAYLRNLYFPETQWCLEAYARFDPAIRELIKIFRSFIGVIENKEVMFKKVRMSYMLTPFIPSNLAEEAQIINSSLAAGSISRQTAAEENPISAADEVKRLEEDDKRKEETEVRVDERKAAQTLTSNLGLTDSSPKPQDGRFENGNQGEKK